MPIFEVQDPKTGTVYEVDAPTIEKAIAAFAPQSAPTQPAQGPVSYTPGGTYGVPPAVGEALVHGVPRIPQALLEGAGALVNDSARALQRWQNNRGVGQPTTQGPDEFHQAVDAMRAEDDAKHPGSVLVSDLGAGMLPLGRFGKTKTVDDLMEAVIRGVGESTVASQIPYQHPEDRGTTAAIGAAFGVATPVATRTKDAVFNMMARRVIDRADPQTKQLAANAVNAFVDPETGQPLRGLNDYTAAQTTGDARLSSLTAQAADVKARDYLRGQLEQRAANIRKVADSLGGQQKILNDEGRAKAFYEVVDSHDMALRKARNESYEKDMATLAASPDGKALRVPLDSFIDTMDNVSNQMGDIVQIAKEGGASPKLVEILEQLYKAPGPVKAMYKTAKVPLNTYQDLTVLLNEGRGYGAAIVSDPKVARWNGVRAQLAGALKTSAESLPANVPGAQQFRDITQRYSQASDGIRRFEDDVVVKLFGDKDVLANPDAAFDKFLKASPSAQSLGLQILDQRNPELVGYLRQRYLRNVVDEATGGAEAAMKSNVDPKKLFEGLMNKNIMNSPLFTNKQKAWMAAAADDLRVILNSLPDTAGVGTPITPSDVVTNAISMNPIFGGRLIARVVTGFGLENLLFTPEGRKALSTVRNLSTASDKAKQQTAAYLSALLARGATPPEKENPE